MARAGVIAGVVLLAIAFVWVARRTGKKAKFDSRFKPWHPSK